MKKLIFGLIGIGALAALVLSLACKTPAQFEVTSLDIIPKEIAAGESVIVTVNVENVGQTEGIYHAALLVDGTEAEAKDITLAAGAKQDISFQLTEDTPGTYKIELGNLVDTLKVLKPAEFKVVGHSITPNPGQGGRRGGNKN